MFGTKGEKWFQNGEPQTYADNLLFLFMDYEKKFSGTLRGDPYKLSF